MKDGANFSKLTHCDSECRMEKIEADNRRQEQEIFSLKIVADKDKKVVNQLNDRVAQLEALVISENSKKIYKEDLIPTRSKRPARLLPAQFL